MTTHPRHCPNCAKRVNVNIVTDNFGGIVTVDLGEYQLPSINAVDTSVFVDALAKARSGHNIQAIKLIREHIPLHSLLTAKDYFDAYVRPLV